MKIFGQLEDACIEQLSSDPAASVQGRIYTNTTDGKTKIDDGTNKRALLRNDTKIVIGNHATAANNVRLNRADSGVLQAVLGNDATAEGTFSTATAQLSVSIENHLNAGKPAAGNAGRLMFISDVGGGEVHLDDGSSVAALLKLTTKGDVLTRSASAITRLPVGSNNLFLKANSATATGLEWALPSGVLVANAYTADHTLTTSENAVDGDASGGSFSFTLPDASTVPGREFILGRTDQTFGNTISIVGTIEGATDYALHTKGERYRIYSNGVEYKLISHETKTDQTSTTIGFNTSIYKWTWTTVADVGGSLQNKYATFETVSSAGAFTKRYIWFNVGGLGSDPLVAGRTAHAVAVATNASANTVATAAAAVLNALADLTASAAANVITSTSDNHGVPEAAASGNTGFTSADTNAPTKGTHTDDVLEGWREGRFWVSRIKYHQTVAGTAGSAGSLYVVPLPSGLVADTTTYGATLNATLGVEQYKRVLPGNLSGYSSSVIHLFPYLLDSKNVAFILNLSLASQALWGAATLGLNTTLVAIGGTYRVPIAGWKD